MDSNQIQQQLLANLNSTGKMGALGCMGWIANFQDTQGPLHGKNLNPFFGLLDAQIAGLASLSKAPPGPVAKARQEASEYLSKMNQDGLAQLSGQNLIAPLATPASSPAAGSSSSFDIV